MLRTFNGTPFVGYVSLTNATPAADIPIYVTAGSASAYTLGANERIVLFGAFISSNDNVVGGLLTQITDKAASPKVLTSTYTTAAQPNAPVTLAAGGVLGRFGSLLRAVTAAITSGKTCEVTIFGGITRT